MSESGDRLKELVQDKEISNALALFLKLPLNDLAVVCAFLIRVHCPKLKLKF